ALFLLTSTVLLLARALVPSPSGFGTHTQLGLPPCAFRAIFDLPCPTCGMTTAFAHMARGELARGFRAHALGSVLFVLTGLGAALSGYFTFSGAPVCDTLARVSAGRVALALASAVLVHWLARVTMLVWP